MTSLKTLSLVLWLYIHPILIPFNAELQQHQTNTKDLKISSVSFILESFKMINAKKLVKLARKWQTLAAISRKRITWPRNTTDSSDANDCSTSSVAEEGHFVVYSADERRFVLPLEYLKKDIVRELLKLGEEEFGMTSSGPLTLPCDADLMEYMISLIRRPLTKEVEEALIMSVVSGRCSSSSHSHLFSADCIYIAHALFLLSIFK